ncbi:MAG: threonine--tRNA ligase [Patescibacteria group bacterium]|nr:threonine--tRNA ligase [Patescibacteria group bacterium]
MKLSKEEKSKVLRHSTSHVLAAAVLEMFPEAKFGVGPAAEDGFYYDFELPRTLIPEDLPLIEEKMRNIINGNYQFEKQVIPAQKAKELFKEAKQPYKTELIEDLEKMGENRVSVYRSGHFVDLCAGPHLESTGEIDSNAFRLIRISGAYWKGDESRQQLQRIFGVVFENKKKLKQHLFQMEEAKKRAHRKLGKELDLFVFSNLVGKGLPLFTPKGTAIWKELEKFIVEEEARRGYLRVHTPDITRVALYKLSGHWDHYRDDMYPVMKLYDDEYVLRPMACPYHFEIYNARPRSYRELPLRYAELVKLYRKEKSGELSGLIRHAGGWTLADAHIICRPDQIEIEFENVIDLIQYCMKILNITEYWYRFSKWDEKNEKGKYIDDPKAWENTQQSMKKILDKIKLEYVEVEDEAAFYGPKLDVQMRNINGKEDTAFTVQIDFAMPERFKMSYIDKDGKKQRPMIIHRSSIGCIERTMAFLIEKYAGAFPVWLAPIQVAIFPISEKFSDYAGKINETLCKKNIRLEMYDSDDSLGKRIAEATKQKIPLMLIVGEREEEKDAVAVRRRDGKKQEIMKIDKFVSLIENLIENRK